MKTEQNVNEPLPASGLLGFWYGQNGHDLRVEVMAESGHYIMLRYKGCIPFVKNYQEFWSEIVGFHRLTRNKPNVPDQATASRKL